MRWVPLVMLLGACNAVYAPNTVNTPLFRQRGELHAHVDKRNLQVAYAVTDHAGVMLNGYYRAEEHANEDGSSDESGWLVEAGGGYYRNVTRPWLTFETYAGVGLGHVDLQHRPNGEPTKSFVTDGVRAFLQPSFGFTTDYVDGAISLRGATVWYYDTRTRYWTTEELFENDLGNIDVGTWVFLEPALTLRAGYKWIRVQLQIGKSYKLNSRDLSRDDNLNSIGISIDVIRAFDRTPP